MDVWLSSFFSWIRPRRTTTTRRTTSSWTPTPSPPPRPHRHSTVRSLRVLTSTLLPFNYTFLVQPPSPPSDQKEVVLAEVSACHFLPLSGPTRSSYNGSYWIELVGDGGEIFHAQLDLILPEEADRKKASSGDSDQQFDNATLVIALYNRSSLWIPGYNDPNNTTTATTPTPEVDAEGCTLFTPLLTSGATESSPEEPGEATTASEIWISSESPLAITRFDRRTGQALLTPPVWHLPEGIAERVEENHGFESLTLLGPRGYQLGLVPDRDQGFSNTTSNGRLEPLVFIVSTTETSIHGDDPGTHRLWFWNASGGSEPVLQLQYQASTWSTEGGEYLSVSEMVSLSDYLPPITSPSTMAATQSPSPNVDDDDAIDSGYMEESSWEGASLLALERGYNGITNMVRLFEVELSGFPQTRSRKLMEWTEHVLTSAFDDYQVELPVDNYEAMCFFPPLPPLSAGDAPDTNQSTSVENSLLLLLINDDNHNPKQIGTQFVVLRLLIDSKVRGGEFVGSPFDSAASTRWRFGRGILLGMVMVGLLIASWSWARHLRQSRAPATDQADMGDGRSDDPSILRRRPRRRERRGGRGGLVAGARGTAYNAACPDEADDNENYNNNLTVLEDEAKDHEVNANTAENGRSIS